MCGCFNHLPYETKLTFWTRIISRNVSSYKYWRRDIYWFQNTFQCKMSAKYHNRKTQVLNEVYRKEGNDLLEKKDYEGGVKKYNQVSIAYDIIHITIFRHPHQSLHVIDGMVSNTTGATSGAWVATLLQHMCSPPVISGVRVARFLILCVVFCRSLFLLLSFCGHCSVLLSIYCFWLSIWCLQKSPMLLNLLSYAWSILTRVDLPSMSALHSVCRCC